MLALILCFTKSFHINAIILCLTKSFHVNALILCLTEYIVASTKSAGRRQTHLFPGICEQFAQHEGVCFNLERKAAKAETFCQFLW